MGKRKKLIEVYKETKRSSLLVYIIARILVLLCLITQLIHGDLHNAFLCGLTLILLMMPFFVSHNFKIEIPNFFEIVIMLFIFSSEILGEINSFYIKIPIWDTLLHTLNGFLCAGVGFSLVNLLNENSEKISLSPFYVAVVAFCFSMTIGVLWEFIEWGADNVMLTDMQKDKIVSTISTVTLDETNSNKSIAVKNIDKTILFDKQGNELAVINGGYLDIGLYDTMKDMFVNFIGAVVFCICGYLYLKKGNFKFTEHFMVKRREKQE
ncbi:MAG: hypothetical protein HFJ49_04640 [Clostridia bacterium]|nr:hypothetical protein [Clostridia bacterium]